MVHFYLSLNSNTFLVVYKALNAVCCPHRKSQMIEKKTIRRLTTNEAGIFLKIFLNRGQILVPLSQKNFFHKNDSNGETRNFTEKLQIT